MRHKIILNEIHAYVNSMPVYPWRGMGTTRLICAQRHTIDGALTTPGELWDYIKNTQKIYACEGNDNQLLSFSCSVKSIQDVDYLTQSSQATTETMMLDYKWLTMEWTGQV